MGNTNGLKKLKSLCPKKSKIDYLIAIFNGQNSSR